MAKLTAHYNDSPEDGDFIVIYETETQGCSPYFTLRFGGGLSVFLNPDRLRVLAHVINEAITAQSWTMLEAQSEAEGAAV